MLATGRAALGPAVRLALRDTADQGPRAGLLGVHEVRERFAPAL
jgi:hypothetical protein